MLTKNLNMSEIRISIKLKLNTQKEVVRMAFLLSFDLPRNANFARLRIFRRLRKIGAELVHHSLWRHESLEELASIALMVKKFGGSALVLEEKLVVK